MSNANQIHKPVLLNEVLNYLQPAPGQFFIDATLGEGGHTLAIARLVRPNGKVLAIENDPRELELFNDRVKDESLTNIVSSVQGNFRDVSEIVKQLGFPHANGILFDLGFSSWQIERSGRGFSYSRNEPLDMRFNPDDPGLYTASDLINAAPQERLAWILREYGEEARANDMAKAIVEAREKERIETTGDLMQILSAFGPSRGKVPAARTAFQALRIAVNSELDNLKEGLSGALDILTSGGKIAVISFHSLEDRIVKQTFKSWLSLDYGNILTKKVVKPEYSEVKENKRARSAKLRVFEVN